MRSEGLEGVIALLRQGAAVADLDDIAARRAGMDALADLDPLPDDVAVEAVDADGVPGELITPPGADPSRWLFYLHGGAYVTGSMSSHRAHVARLARGIGVRALNVDYRLAPEHPFPAAVDDTLAAYRWLIARADPDRVVVAGDSAGGGLALSLLVAARDAEVDLPAGASLISPWTDLTMTASTYDTRAQADPMIDRRRLSAEAQRYLAGVDPTTALASPLHAPLAGLPPLLVQVGDDECLLDDSVELARRAEAAGVDVTLEVTPEAIHVWHAFAAFAPEGAEAVQRLAEWARAQLEPTQPR